MDNLFKKAFYFTDIHFGRSNNAPTALCDNIDFVKWAVDEAKTRGCETFIFGGDWHDNRNQIHVSTMHASIECLQLINDAFEKTYFLPGNHDLFYRDRRDVASIEFARYLPKINIVRDPMTIGNVTLLPWLVGDETKTLKVKKSRYVFGHFEMAGFLMNAAVEMPESDHAVKIDAFKAQDYVFTGHFHMRQHKGNVVYTGNVMPFSFSDNWMDDRGAMILEWGKEPDFVSWPDQPLFRTMKLSELLENPSKFLKKKITARVSLDLDITYEEAQLIKDTLSEEHGARKVELVHQTSQEADQSFDGEVTFQSIDQIVIEGLNSVQSTGFRNDVLVEIYRSLNH